MATSRMLFVNLPVSDLDKSKHFFAQLGFEFNQQFTNEDAACMVVSEQASVMLLREPFFKSFTRRAVADVSKQTEVMTAVSCESRAEVDALFDKALATGGAEAMPAQDLGFMYSRAFYDLDNHHWELVWMDPAAVQ